MVNLRLLSALLGIIALVLASCSTADESPGFVSVDEAQTSFAPRIPASQVTLAIEPFKSMPGNLADELTEGIADDAKAADITVIRRIGAQTTHRLQGQLTAVGGDSGTVVVYIFEVYDADGTRVYRFNGQEVAGGATGDPWVGAGGDTMDKIAGKVILELKAWLSRA